MEGFVQTKNGKLQKFQEIDSRNLVASDCNEEGYQQLYRKYADTEKEIKELRQSNKLKEKHLENILKEKENLQREYNRSVLIRIKLEDVCREQQKLLKTVKNESMQKIHEEEERRIENQSKFQHSIQEINQALVKNNEENIKLSDHNIEMTKKLKFLTAQCRTREQQLEKINEQTKLESQLHQAKLKKVQMEAEIEKENLLKEKQLLANELFSSQKLLKELTEKEKLLKKQLHLYTTKYDDFQSSFQKSTDILSTYKIELEKVSKNAKKLERESFEWQQKWEKSNAALIQFATEKIERDEHTIRCNKQVEQLQKLLRTLQSERTLLYKTIRHHNIEPPILPQDPILNKPLTTSNGAEKDKIDIMSKSCLELKETMAKLQDQMKSIISTKDNDV